MSTRQQKILVQQNGKNGCRKVNIGPVSHGKWICWTETRCIHFYLKKGDFGALHRSMTGKTIFNLVNDKVSFGREGWLRGWFSPTKTSKDDYRQRIIRTPLFPCTFSLNKAYGHKDSDPVKCSPPSKIILLAHKSMDELTVLPLTRFRNWTIALDTIEWRVVDARKKLKNPFLFTMAHSSHYWTTTRIFKYEMFFNIIA